MKIDEKQTANMNLTFLRIPNKILMMLDPQLNKNEFILCLLLINPFMTQYNRYSNIIKIRAGYIHGNNLNTTTIKQHTKSLLNSLVGKNIICSDEKTPDNVLFEKIERDEKNYTITINKKIRSMLKFECDFTIVDVNHINQLKSYQLIKFYCLIKMWANNKYYICYIKWLKWYLNIQDIETKVLINMYINKFVVALKNLNINIKTSKHKMETDHRTLEKIVFDIFDTNEYGAENESKY